MASTSGGNYYTSIESSGLTSLSGNVLPGSGGGGTASDFNPDLEYVEKRGRKAPEGLGGSGIGTGDAENSPTASSHHLAEVSATNDQNYEGYESSPTPYRHLQPPTDDSQRY